MLIVAVVLALLVMALLVDNKRQGRHIRERYTQLCAALDHANANAVQAIVAGNIFSNYLSAVVKRPWQATETPGLILVTGDSAVFWPHGKDQRGFPIGDVVEWANSNGVWYVTSVHLD